MRVSSGCLIVGAVLFSNDAVMAQDLFESTSSTSHSYNYLEAQYLVDVDVSPPVLATLLLDVTDNWSFKAEYISQDHGDVSRLLADPSVGTVTAEEQRISGGALYHTPLAIIGQSDFIAGAMLGRTDIAVELPAQGRSETSYSVFTEFYSGIRRTLGTRLEGELAINYYIDSDGSALTADAKLVYRVASSFDVALAGNELGVGNVIGIGLRYAW